MLKKKQVVKDVEGSGRGSFQGSIPFVWRDWGKPQKQSVRIASCQGVYALKPPITELCYYYQLHRAICM